MASTGNTRGFNQGGVVTYYDDTLNTEHQTDLWRKCPMMAIMCNPTIAVCYFEDFHAYNATDDWTLTQATTGAAAISTAAPGVLELDSNSTTATQGANLQNTNAAFVPASGKDIWFEARIKIVDTYDKAEVFVGLAAEDTSIIAGSDMTAANHIGWECNTDDGVLLFGAERPPPRRRRSPPPRSSRTPSLTSASTTTARRTRYSNTSTALPLARRTRQPTSRRWQSSRRSSASRAVRTTRSCTSRASASSS